ncbi:MAG: ABC transporter permease [Tannerellaceae bacterium]|jgi:ABC-2 type transport system permease protein|nr:ABC transporter permease [Tannerellaceae bacterium]
MSLPEPASGKRSRPASTFIRLASLLHKDVLLLLRDRAGLSMMFLMPMLLAFIMTYLQNSTFNSINETGIAVAVLNLDADSLGATIERQIAAAGPFELHTEHQTREALIADVQRGAFMIGIVIPEQTTARLRRTVRSYVAAAFEADSLPPVEPPRIEVYIDPVSKPTFRSAVTGAIREQAARIESAFIARAIAAEVSLRFPVSIPNIQLGDNLVLFDERFALARGASVPNATQHNIPAWSIFAIFFIAISLSGNIIKERDEGSYARLRTMPFPQPLYSLSKVIVYQSVCLLQYASIILAGMYIFPFVGLPALAPAPVVPTLLMGASAAAAATGYGIGIGRIASTHQQAAIFAAISTVIMAAIGGVWIPVFIMPGPMRYLSALSPLNWGLEGFYDLFLRGSGVAGILPECALSVAFGLLCAAVAPRLFGEKDS